MDGLYASDPDHPQNDFLAAPDCTDQKDELIPNLKFWTLSNSSLATGTA